MRWPLNIILSRKSLTKYQILFRHLFYCKYIERQLCKTWLTCQSTKELNLQKATTYSYCITQKMIHFAKNMVYYLVYEVLEQKWAKFEQSMTNVTSFDDIIKFHNTLLDECLKESLLKEPNLLKTLSKINTCCSLFSSSTQNLTENMRVSKQISVRIMLNIFLKNWKLENDDGDDLQETFQKRKQKIMVLICIDFL